MTTQAIETVVAIVIAVYVLSGLLLALILWIDARFPRWSLRGVLLAIFFSPIALLDYLISAMLSKVAR